MSQLLRRPGRLALGALLGAVVCIALVGFTAQGVTGDDNRPDLGPSVVAGTPADPGSQPVDNAPTPTPSTSLDDDPNDEDHDGVDADAEDADGEDNDDVATAVTPGSLPADDDRDDADDSVDHDTDHDHDGVDHDHDHDHDGTADHDDAGPDEED